VSGCDVEKTAKLSPGPHEVGERVIVEFSQEGSQGLSKDARQLTVAFDRARVRGRIEAFNDVDVLFEITYDVAEANRLGGSGETNASSLASDRLDVSASPKSVNHLHEVVGRDPVPVADFVNRNQAIVSDTQEDEDAKRVVREASETHKRE
jgi:hypothetical protein